MDDGNKIAKAAKLNPINDPLTYTEVIQLLFQMESTCQPHGIHQLINTAVANNKVVPKFEDSSVEKLESDVSEFEAKALAAKTKLQTLNKKVKSKENYIELNGNYENQLNSVFEFLSSAKSQAENEKADLEKEINLLKNEIKSLSAQNPNQTDEISKLNIKLANLELKKSINSDKLSDAEKKLTLFKSNRDNYDDLDSRAKTAKSVATTNTQYYENLSKQPEPPESSDKITYKYNLDSAKKIADDSNKAAKDTRDLADVFAENLIKPYRQEMKKSDTTLNRSLGYEVRAKN